MQTEEAIVLEGMQLQAATVSPGRGLGIGVAAMMMVVSAVWAQQSQPEPLRTSVAEGAHQRRADAEVPPVRRARPRARRTTSLDLDEAKIEVAWGPVPAEGGDFAAIDELEPGAVVAFTTTAAIKLSTSADLFFDELRVPQGNAAEDYPGVYALWIQRADDGWRLIFNHKADVWGTQYDPAADAGRVRLTHEVVESTGESFHAELTMKDGSSGLLVLSWGGHHWSAPFRLAAGEAAGHKRSEQTGARGLGA